MIRKLLFAVILLVASQNAISQELKCQVQVTAPGVSNVDKRIFESLRSSISEFMNNRKWTTDKYTIEERIECTILLTIKNVTSLTRFSGSLQVQSTRAVFNSDYNSQMFNLLDDDIQFEYLDNTQLEFSPDQYQSDLTSILGYYAYFILGVEYDSFELNGGSQYYSIAQRIVNNAQNSNIGGWKAFENDANRYWLVENMLHQSFRPLRKCIYLYHMHGLDKMYENPNQARVKIKQGIDDLKKVHQVKPLSYNLKIFFQAKADELVNIYSEAPQQEKGAVHEVLQTVNPANISTYQSLKK
ncbi:MAG: hypothetical protein ACI8XB_000364 [Patiriisocius sp.]|jgi:hypothetical protein